MASKQRPGIATVVVLLTTAIAVIAGHVAKPGPSKSGNGASSTPEGRLTWGSFWSRTESSPPNWETSWPKPRGPTSRQQKTAAGA
eukprot:12754386-Prorocentrum_lima.AAC.1